MDLEQRKQFVAQKLNAGLSLGDVQKALAEEGVTMTYLDLRLLASELKVDWQKQDAKKVVPKAPAVVTDGDDAGADAVPASGTQVTVGRLVRPGASMSGEVTFGSGARGEWWIDSYGRLGYNPAKGSLKPTEQDLREFQTELQRKLSGEV